MNTDTPIIKPSEDSFSRADYAKRIAEIVMSRGNEDSIVSAIYGAWGSGKSSVLNLIREHLNAEEILAVNFNPWQFESGDKMVIQFFNTLAFTIGTSPFSQGEKIKNKIKEYGESLLPVVEKIPTGGGILGGIFKTVTKAIGDTSPEDHKRKLSELLRNEKKRIVVIIDDIDRLDDEEIYNLFKMVKLTGELPYVSYVLSFDIDVVSAAISKRYGNGKSNYGYQYIEKIVQLPVRLPKIRFSDMQSYTFDLIKASIKASSVVFDEDEFSRFYNLFSKYFMDKILVPRNAVQVANVARFTLPILAEEVNGTDILVLESLKLFYPSAYAVINSHPKIFVESDKDFVGTLPSRYETQFSKEELLEKAFSDCDSEKEKSHIQSLLHTIFPLFQENTANINYSHETRLKWYNSQRVASSKYLHRYLSFSIDQEDIPDSVFNDFLNSIPASSPTEVRNSLSDLLKEYSVHHVIHVMRSKEDTLDTVVAQKICLALAQNCDHLDEFSSIFLSSTGNSAMQSSMFIRRIVERLDQGEARIELVNTLIKASLDNKSFTNAVMMSLQMGFEKGDSPFSLEEFHQFNILLLQPYLDDGSSSVFSSHEDKVCSLLNSWKFLSADEFHEYIHDCLTAQPEIILDVLKTFTPISWSTARPNPFLSNFRKEEYEFLVNLVPEEWLMKAASSYMDAEGLSYKPPYSIEMRGDAEQSDANILNQFLLQRDLSLKNEGEEKA